MSGRDDLDLAAIRLALEQERDALTKASATTADDRAPVELDQQSVGRLSRMDAIQVQALAVAGRAACILSKESLEVGGLVLVVDQDNHNKLMN